MYLHSWAKNKKPKMAKYYSFNWFKHKILFRKLVKFKQMH